MNITVSLLMKRKMCEAIRKAMTPGDKLDVFTRQNMVAANPLDFFSGAIERESAPL
jgi:hypothetical protein